MNERIKQLRKVLRLTQQEFSDKLRVSRSNIATYEVGKNNPTDAVISLICREFNVNEQWLRTGKGEMFIPEATDALDALVRERGLSQSDYILIEKFLALKSEERQAVLNFALQVAAAFNREDSSSTVPDYEAEARAKAEAYYHKLLEENVAANPPVSVSDAAAELEDMKRRIEALEQEDMSEEITPDPAAGSSALTDTEKLT